MIKLIKSLYTNKVVSFMITKYLAFGLQIINSMLIAKYLGLYFFGIYGFITLVLQYINYTNFGVYYSYQVIFASKNEMTSEEQKRLTSSAFWSLVAISIALFVGVIVVLSVDSLNLNDKYNFKEFIVPVITIGILVHFNNLFITIFRLFGKVKTINIYSLIPPVFQFIALFVFKGKELLWAVVLALLISHVIGLLLFIYYSPIKGIVFGFPKLSYVKELFRRGFFLLCYALSFYGIIITARTLVSYYYSIEDFALFNFSNSISQAIFLLLGSLNYLFYPKLINVLSNKTDSRELIDFIEKIRKFYLTLTLLIILFSLLAMPVLFLYLPSYHKASKSLQLLLLGQLLIDNSYGYSTLLVQRGKENILTIIACFTAALVAILSMIFHHFQLSFESVAIAVVISVLFYNFFVIYYGNKLTRQFSSFLSLFRYIYKVELFAPVVFYIFLSFIIKENYLVISLTIGLYLILNYKDLKNIIKECFKMLRNEEILVLRK
ncbi:oligosaccharide flippase family protein [Pedobacter sp. B4-66]|uniref:lipopolysaccharide biosynthesis protein n=1 Tax=Pedobacter sp. B4-66 TaxID=2817280 RepID=UPI001BDA59EE|nr:oligosaccharide flippase family protein [Pedobacter sp. B4-66]